MNWENTTEPQYRHVQDQRKFTALMNHEICSSDDGIELVYLIKSAPENFERRAAIRKTWGKTGLDSPSTRTVFLIGLTSSNQTQERLRQEHLDHGMDLVQGDFADHYYNSTLKTMMALKWAATVCPRCGHLYFYSKLASHHGITTNILAECKFHIIRIPKEFTEIFSTIYNMSIFQSNGNSNQCIQYPNLPTLKSDSKYHTAQQSM